MLTKNSKRDFQISVIQIFVIITNFSIRYNKILKTIKNQICTKLFIIKLFIINQHRLVHQYIKRQYMNYQQIISITKTVWYIISKYT